MRINDGVYGPTSSTDNALARWDGTTGMFIQNSGWTLSDTGDLVSSSGAVTYSGSGNFINATNDFTISTTGAFNITLSPGSGGNFSAVSFGTASVVSDGACTLGSSTSTTAINSSTGTTLTVTSGNINLDATLVFVNNASTPAALQAGHLGLGTSTVSTSRIISAIESSSSVTNALFLDFTHSGSTATVRGMNLTTTHSGSATSPSVVNIGTATHTVDPSGTATMIGLQGSGTNGSTSTQGTKVYVGVRGSTTVGSSNTAGTLRAISIHGQAVSGTGGGSTTLTAWAGLFEDDVQVSSDKKLILEGSSTTKGDSYFIFTSATPSIDTYLNGTQAWTWTTSLNKSEVVLGTKAGSSTTYAKVGGIIEANTSSVSNGTTVETDLQTFSIPANTLATNGDSITFEMAGSYAANANTKRVKIKYGATTMFDSTALAINSGTWACSGRIVRTGAATQTYYGTFTTDNALLVAKSFQGTAAETLSGAVTLKATGQSNTASNDVTETNSVIRWESNK